MSIIQLIYTVSQVSSMVIIIVIASKKKSIFSFLYALCPCTRGQQPPANVRYLWCYACHLTALTLQTLHRQRFTSLDRNYFSTDGQLFNLSKGPGLSTPDINSALAHTGCMETLYCNTAMQCRSNHCTVSAVRQA